MEGFQQGLTLDRSSHPNDERLFSTMDRATRLWSGSKQDDLFTLSSSIYGHLAFQRRILR
jgi:hypothetical protein